MHTKPIASPLLVVSVSSQSGAILFSPLYRNGLDVVRDVSSDEYISYRRMPVRHSGQGREFYL